MIYICFEVFSPQSISHGNNLGVNLGAQTLFTNITMGKCIFSSSKQLICRWIFETQPISVSVVVFVCSDSSIKYSLLDSPQSC